MEGGFQVKKDLDKVILLHDEGIGVLDKDVPGPRIHPGSHALEGIAASAVRKQLAQQAPRDFRGLAPLLGQGLYCVPHTPDRVDIPFYVCHGPPLELLALVKVAELAFVPGAVPGKSDEEAEGLAGRPYGTYLVVEPPGRCFRYAHAFGYTSWPAVWPSFQDRDRGSSPAAD